MPRYFDYSGKIWSFDQKHIFQTPYIFKIGDVFLRSYDEIRTFMEEKESQNRKDDIKFDTDQGEVRISNVPRSKTLEIKGRADKGLAYWYKFSGIKNLRTVKKGKNGMDYNDIWIIERKG